MSTEPPTISYRGDQGEGEGQETSQYARVTNQVLSVFTWVILLVVLLFWAVVGAIFWIPLIIRALIRFSVSHLEASFEGQKPTSAAKSLRNAVAFYKRGFVVAVEVVLKEEVEEEPEGPAMPDRLLLEVLWALLVWYFILLWLGWIQASPVDLWDWFFSIPWGQHFSDLFSIFRG